MKIRSITIALLSVLCLQSCVFGGKDKEKDKEETSLLFVGDPAPEFVAYDGKGGEFVSPVGFTGKTTLFLLFTTLCPDCQREMPKIEYVYQTVAKEDETVQVITISRQQEASVVEGFWEENGYEMPYYLDPARAIYSLFATSYVPRIYIINSSGVIEWLAIEELDMTQEELAAKVLSYK